MADDAKYGHGEFCWHEIATRDTDAAKRFYEGLLGWTTEDTPMPGESDDVYIMARVNGGDVAGIWRMTGDHFEGVPAHWGTYVWVDDVDATTAKAKALGATVVAEPMEIPGIGRMAALQDPGGAAFSVYHGTGNTGAARHDMATIGAVGWNELMTPDAETAKAFYKELFGWEGETSPIPGREDEEYTSLKRDGQSIGGLMEMGTGEEWQGVPAHWMPYLTVEDCAAAQSKVEGLGGSVRVPATTIPGIGTFSVIADPSGGHFSVMEWDMSSME